MKNQKQEPVNHLERIKEKLFQNRFVAWLVLLFTVIAAVLAIIPHVREVLGLLPKSESPPPLFLHVSTYDPRFEGSGERLNWGGGSQALYLEDGLGSDRFGEDWYLMDDAVEQRMLEAVHQGRPLVWEVIPIGDEDGLCMRVDVSYAADAKDRLVIHQWGVRVRPLSVPANGFFVHYNTGGAYIGRDGGLVQVSTSGDFPIRHWVEFAEGEERDRGSMLEYLAPGELQAFEFHITGDAGNVGKIANTAVYLTAIAQVWMNGKEWVIESRNGIRAILPGDETYLAYHVQDSDTVEDLRPRSVVEK